MVGWLLLALLVAAAGHEEYLVIALLVAPPLLALAITGPVHRSAVRPLIRRPVVGKVT